MDTFSMVPAAKPTMMARPFQAIHFRESVRSESAGFCSFVQNQLPFIRPTGS